MREIQEEVGWELRDYAERSAYRRSQYRGGVAAARGHSTNTARAAAGRFKGGRRRQPAPLPTRHHVKAHRTTLLATLHQPGGSTLLKGWVGFSCNPAGQTGPQGQKGRAEEGLCTRRHWGTFTRLWPLGGGLGAWAVAFTEKKWHLAR